MPKLAAILATLTGLATQVIGVTIMLTTHATGDTGTAACTGLILTTSGLILTLTGIPPAARAFYIWSRDRGYVLYHEHQAQDAALPPATPVARLTRTK
ncbi:hypothetical protein ACFZB5_33595 [Streptomyces nodosus]|uniref:hypothetical protein n=1 Tax=Streptomyces nodosus TaxID=40318 RepID=UPI0036EB0DB6